MNSSFLNLKIKWKLLIAFGSILFLSLILVATGLYAFSRIFEYKSLLSDVNQLDRQFLNLKVQSGLFLNEEFKSKEYQNTGNCTSLQEHRNIQAKLYHQLESLNALSLIKEMKNKEAVSSAFQHFRIYNSSFNELEKKIKIRGFKDDGLEGELRAAIHQVEKANYNYDQSLMLMLRRHEKDFFLRKDLKYLSKFNKGIDYLKTNISNNTSDYQETSYQNIIASVITYQDKFNKIVALEKEIGLTNNKGLKGQLMSRMNRMSPLIGALKSSIQQHINGLINRSIILMAILLVLQLVIGLILVVFYSNILSNTIKEIKTAMETLASGYFPEKLIIRSKDELAKTKIAVNNLVLRMQSAVNFADAIGKGNLDKAYETKFNNDVLAKAIIAMQKQLVVAKKKQDIINWNNEGIKEINHILHNTELSLAEIGENALFSIVKYLKANQGALYLLEDNVLTRQSTYAYERKKFVKQTIKNGEGLLGQCVLEKSTLFFTDIPQGYTHITSGMGKSTPSALLLVPLQYNHKVYGAIEIASFKTFEQHEIHLLEQCAKAIASVIINITTVEKTKSMLEKAEIQSEQLQAQEEELKQNLEEFTATEEELQRQNKYLKDTIGTLQNQIAAQKQPKELVLN